MKSTPRYARLGVEALEPRCLPATNLFAVGADAGSVPLVEVYDATARQKVFSFLAFEEGFRGGVRVAVGDYNGDGEQDIIAGAGPGAGPHVRVFDGVTLAVLANSYAFDPAFAGGVTVAAGQFNLSDGLGAQTAVVVGAGAGGPGGHVKLFTRGAGEVASFLAFAPGFLGGVTVAAGNTTGTNSGSVVVGAGAGAGGHVKVFGPRFSFGSLRPGGGSSIVFEPLAELRSFFAFDSGFGGGVSVGLADVDGVGQPDVVVGAGAGAAGGHVKAFSDQGGALVLSLRPFPATFTGATRVGGADVTGDGRRDVLLAPGAGLSGGSRVLFFDPVAGAVTGTLPLGDPFRGGAFVSPGGS